MFVDPLHASAFDVWCAHPPSHARSPARASAKCRHVAGRSASRSTLPPRGRSIGLTFHPAATWQVDRPHVPRDALADPLLRRIRRPLPRRAERSRRRPLSVRAALASPPRLSPLPSVLCLSLCAIHPRLSPTFFCPLSARAHFSSCRDSAEIVPRSRARCPNDGTMMRRWLRARLGAAAVDDNLFTSLDSFPASDSDAFATLSGSKPSHLLHL